MHGNDSDRRGSAFVAVMAAAVSVVAFLYFYGQGAILLYGDAVAHLNIARRVFDSQTPGLQQLGTVWLPLPHLLTLPFVLSDSMWRSGVGGSIASMLAYVAGCAAIFRLVRGFGGTIAGWMALLLYGLNPNLLYMQSTAMTEPLFLAAFLWAVTYYSEFARQISIPGEEHEAGRSLWRCGLALAATMLTRYDGWFISAFIALLVLARVLPHVGRLWPVRRAFFLFAAIVVLTPTLWMAYNYVLFENPIEFATGPYSAKAIAERTTPPGSPHHPGWHAPYVAHLHFLKAAKLNVAEGATEDWLLLIAVFGAGASAFLLPRARGALLLWLPVPFYAMSIAWGSVPIFVPQWWPFSYYNVRYGLQLLPAIAVFTAAVVAVAAARASFRRMAAVFTVLLAVVISSYAAVWVHGPISLREAQANAVTRERFEQRLAQELAKLPPGSVLLMHTGSYVGALQRAGIPLRQTVNEGNFRLWEAALAGPAAHADYIVAVEGDAVAQAISGRQGAFREVVRFQIEGKPPAVIYETGRMR